MVNRDFKNNPITDSELMYCRWYVNVNDLIGGWNVSTSPVPESELNYQNGEFEVGTFLTKACAEHIAYTHNAWWDTVVAATYMENLGSDFLTYCNHAELTRTH